MWETHWLTLGSHEPWATHLIQASAKLYIFRLLYEGMLSISGKWAVIFIPMSTPCTVESKSAISSDFEQLWQIYVRKIEWWILWVVFRNTKDLMTHSHEEVFIYIYMYETRNMTPYTPSTLYSAYQLLKVIVHIHKYSRYAYWYIAVTSRCDIL